MVQLNELAESDDEDQEIHLVTGGGGYVGGRLAEALHEQGHRVIMFDIKEPLKPLESGMLFIKADIRNYASVEKAFEGVDCVYHVASYGMSGREQLDKRLIEEVNVAGTNNVIRACVHWNISRLVYTSTYNVVFGGQVILDGDEKLPYLPLDQHPDHYSFTKSIAEQAILQANGTLLDGAARLRTTALRLAGVYGPGEQRHLPRVVSYLQSGLFCFVYGDPESLVEFLHVDNLIQAHVKAAVALTESKKYVAAGQSYFISDCKPINNFEFFRPLVEGLGYKFPTIRLPVSLIYYMAFLIEIIHGIVGRVYNFQPMLTRTEVYKTGVTHYFSNDKAKVELGYEPTVQNDLTHCVKWFRKAGFGRRQKSFGEKMLVDIALAAIFVIFIMWCLPMAS